MKTKSYLMLCFGISRKSWLILGLFGNIMVNHVHADLGDTLEQLRTKYGNVLKTEMDRNTRDHLLLYKFESEELFIGATLFEGRCIRIELATKNHSAFPVDLFERLRAGNALPDAPFQPSPSTQWISRGATQTRCALVDHDRVEFFDSDFFKHTKR